MRSAQELDYYLATHNTYSRFARLNYGLAPNLILRFGEDGSIIEKMPPTVRYSYVHRSIWQLLEYSFIKSNIIIGTFFCMD
jgi:hypothetical protein